MKKYLHIAILMLILPHNGMSQIIDTLTRKEYNEYLITQKIDSLLNNSSSLNSLKKQCNLHERQLTFFCEIDSAGKISNVYSETLDECPEISRFIVETISSETLFWRGSNGTNEFRQLVIKASFINKFNWSAALR